MKYRPNLPPLPDRMKHLPVSEKGYPVPFFVSCVDGKYNFQLADQVKWKACVEQDRCWVCGEKMGVFKTFVVGPMAGMNRISGEPPSHIDCAEFAVMACPFLLLPKAKRRELTGDVPTVAAPGVMMPENPGVMMLWTTKSFTRPSRATNMLYVLGDPTTVTWWAEGAKATRAVANAGVAAGVARIEAMIETDIDPSELDVRRQQMTDLEARCQRLQKLLPRELEYCA